MKEYAISRRKYSTVIINRIPPENVVAYQITVFVAAVAAALVLAVLHTQILHATPELRSEDAVARIAPQPARPDVVVVALDDASVAKYGAIKTWPRSLLARGLEQIERGDPKTVVMDIALDKRTKTGDASLWRVMANHRNVVLGMAYDATRSTTYTPDDIRSLVFLEKYAQPGNFTYDASKTSAFPYYLFEPPMSDYAGSSRGIGVFDRETDADGVLRTARLMYLTKVEYPASTAPLPGKFPQSHLADGAPVLLPNISLVASMRAFDVDKESVSLKTGESVHVTGTTEAIADAPVDDQGRMDIRFSGPEGSYPRISFADVAAGTISPSLFKDKIVLIGATAAGDAATDARVTPFGPMPRVEITANAIGTLLSRSFVTRYAKGFSIAIVVVGVIVGLCLMFTSGWRSAWSSLALVAGYLMLVCGFYAFGHVVLPVLPVLIVVAWTFVLSMLLNIGPFRPVEIAVPETNDEMASVEIRSRVA
jgi:adenylate cyclase